MRAMCLRTRVPLSYLLKLQNHGDVKFSLHAAILPNASAIQMFSLLSTLLCNGGKKGSLAPRIILYANIFFFDLGSFIDCRPQEYVNGKRATSSVTVKFNSLLLVSNISP